MKKAKRPPRVPAATEPLTEPLHLTLPVPTWSLNEANGAKWFGRARRKALDLELLEVACLQQHGRHPKVFAAGGRRLVTIHRYGHHLLDHDNLVGGTKQLMDAMVHHRLVVDDSPKWVEKSYGQTLDRKNKRTEITLEAIP